MLKQLGVQENQTVKCRHLVPLDCCLLECCLDGFDVSHVVVRSSGLTTQAQRPGPRDATIATAMLPPGSLQRMVRPTSLCLVSHSLGSCNRSLCSPPNQRQELARRAENRTRKTRAVSSNQKRRQCQSHELSLFVCGIARKTWCEISSAVGGLVSMAFDESESGVCSPE